MAHPQTEINKCPGCGCYAQGAIVKREHWWHLHCWADHLENVLQGLARSRRPVVRRRAREALR